MLNYITWTANPILINGPLTIRWYGLMFVIGFFVFGKAAALNRDAA